jgi:uncharacterized protein involved in exopolysaccharide biosynthesis
MQADPEEPVVLTLPEATGRSLLERRWRVLAVAGAMGGLCGGVIGRFLPSWFESTARLAVIPVEDPTGSGGTSAVEGANAALPMTAAILRSRGVTDELVANLGLTTVYGKSADRAREELLEHVTVTSDRKANLITIAAEDRLPDRARRIAATMAELGARRTVELWAARTHDHRRELEAELGRTNDRLRAAEDALRAFRERNGVVDLPAQIKASVEQAAALERQRIDKQLSLHYLRGFGDGGSVEVQRGSRERQATVRELSALRHGTHSLGPLLPLDSLPGLELEHTRLKRAIDIESARVDLLSLKIGQLTAAEARAAGRPELIDPATLPRDRARPSRLFLCVQCAAAAGALAALVLLLRARRRVQSIP